MEFPDIDMENIVKQNEQAVFYISTDWQYMMFMITCILRFLKACCFWMICQLQISAARYGCSCGLLMVLLCHHEDSCRMTGKGMSAMFFLAQKLNL